MKAVIQRVKNASVEIFTKEIDTTGNIIRENSYISGSCSNGLMILLGVASGDTEQDAILLAQKISKMRIFCDENYKMNLSVKDVGGSILVVSNFTLLADARKGNRPDFFGAANPTLANELYELFMTKLRESDIKVESGVFGADMQVNLTNDGPITIILDSLDLRKK